jgi:hypothetical protein
MPAGTTGYTTIGLNGVGLTGLTGGFTGLLIVPGMTGKYFASFSSSASTSTNADQWNYAIFKDNTIIQNSERIFFAENQTDNYTWHSQAIVNINTLNESINVKTRRVIPAIGTPTLLINPASLTILKLL